MNKKVAKPLKRSYPVTKSEQIIGLMKRANGASVAEMAKATGWQEHSVRGFMSGTLKKKLGLEIVGGRVSDKDRRYQIKALS